MTPLWTVAEAVAATGGRAVNLSDGPIASVSIDSREIAPGALFPIGIVTSLVGVPFFAWLVLSARRSHW